MRVCGIVVRVSATDPEVQVLFPELPDLLRSSEVHSASWVQLRSYLKEKVAAPV
jgi:hypothetical protein